MTQFYDHLKTPFNRRILMVADTESVIAIRIAKDEEDLALQLAAIFPRAVHAPFYPVLREAMKEMKAYFSGTLRAFSFPVADHGSPFHRTVREAMATIPYGKTVSYSELARMAGNPKAFRAAASACAGNALAIYYPCHRVLHKGGSMSGYAYGTETKEWLLAHEVKFSAKKAA